RPFLTGSHSNYGNQCSYIPNASSTPGAIIQPSYTRHRKLSTKMNDGNHDFYPSRFSSVLLSPLSPRSYCIAHRPSSPSHHSSLFLYELSDILLSNIERTFPFPIL